MHMYMHTCLVAVGESGRMKRYHLMSSDYFKGAWKVWITFTERSRSPSPKRQGLYFSEQKQESASTVITVWIHGQKKISFTINISRYKMSEIWGREKKISQPTNPSGASFSQPFSARHQWGTSFLCSYYTSYVKSLRKIEKLILCSVDENRNSGWTHSFASTE